MKEAFLKQRSNIAEYELFLNERRKTGLNINNLRRDHMNFIKTIYVYGKIEKLETICLVLSIFFKEYNVFLAVPVLTVGQFCVEQHNNFMFSYGENEGS